MSMASSAPNTNAAPVVNGCRISAAVVDAWSRAAIAPTGSPSRNRTLPILASAITNGSWPKRCRWMCRWSGRYRSTTSCRLVQRFRQLVAPERGETEQACALHHQHVVTGRHAALVQLSGHGAGAPEVLADQTRERDRPQQGRGEVVTRSGGQRDRPLVHGGQPLRRIAVDGGQRCGQRAEHSELQLDAIGGRGQPSCGLQRQFQQPDSIHIGMQTLGRRRRYPVALGGLGRSTRPHQMVGDLSRPSIAVRAAVQNKRDPFMNLPPGGRSKRRVRCGTQLLVAEIVGSEAAFVDDAAAPEFVDGTGDRVGFEPSGCGQQIGSEVPSDDGRQPAELTGARRQLAQPCGQHRLHPRTVCAVAGGSPARSDRLDDEQRVP